MRRYAQEGFEGELVPDADGDWVYYEDHARLYDAVAALMATGDGAWLWWSDCSEDGATCAFCHYGAPSPSAVKHAPDCPAMAVEAAMRGGDDGDS